MASRAAADMDRLFTARPEEFVRERTALVTALRGAGDDGRAREVARLRKPSMAQWVVNQLARQATPDVDRLLDAVTRLRRGGGGNAAQDHRAALRALTGHAE